MDDTTFRAVYERGDQTLRDALDLAYLTGQRVGDVWSMDERQLGAGELVVRQAKTGTKLTMAVTGELAALLDRIAARKRGLTLRSTRLIVDADGLAIGRAGPGRAALRYRFDQARKAAGVDKADSAGDIRQAQAQLGHASVTTTEIYVRKRKGAKTTPTR
ncbi:tyrosine-type recombinase/integrase [Xanthomonas oryzae]|uniref:tyrosine-type recombinase/integrase n=1 Tax=Xanthomonas oryzae TaxID=347 RepID=UPI00031A0A08|nr:tyrosine-type recombinase/integrase [Xanthomonas oryzae]AZK85977.1 hypothetical protein BO993_01120 [Xanthomonas oryzae pv. oryzae]MDI9072348.1 tyrosine-type recombinase/integrase [Xanthomonas oryzae pv. oryzae]MDI9078033.1 tyrosine-type recombinase/integrase [Xanthomonas oryzae pv. oryzae]MDI9105152.1 tyrosine-type recombinase/integrase [Xanthomonas oryzae pv. oryzae]MDI9913310.1 tyrosine-type recombinase/integrase [Xanthomonas oryzae pv. oryzae]